MSLAKYCQMVPSHLTAKSRRFLLRCYNANIDTGLYMPFISSWTFSFSSANIILQVVKHTRLQNEPKEQSCPSVYLPCIDLSAFLPIFFLTDHCPTCYKYFLSDPNFLVLPTYVCLLTVWQLPFLGKRKDPTNHDYLGMRSPQK